VKGCAGRKNEVPGKQVPGFDLFQKLFCNFVKFIPTTSFVCCPEHLSCPEYAESCVC
jgi:hypothetical protein